ncbi:hypothetical protein CHS0354_029714 [Potamilus streckersoni]|uniref:Uncharacterized protein n=1 Tax=Potamilus streckersoni TaxID=2493646 RepID=A0AAE0VJ15_9BIVA|nr:hypothetical protein CHS0354_029714 [Potamilus streckersoni]
MDNSNIEHVTKPTDVTVSRSSGLSSISNSPLGFSLESEGFETLEFSDILLNNEPNKPNDLNISDNAVTDHNSDSLNVESLSSEETQSDAVSSGRSQIIFSSEDIDCHESVSVPYSKSSMSGAHAKENNSGTKESVPVIAQEQDKVEISVATDKSHADIDEMSSDNIDISEKCISKTSFLGITKSTDDRSFDEKTLINDQEEVNNSRKWKIEEQDKQGKEPKSCSEKLEKSLRVVDTKYVSLEIPGSALETSALDNQNSSCSGLSSEKGAKFEKMLSSDRCQSITEVTDSDEQPTHIDSSDSQAGSSQLTDNGMEEKDQGHSVAVKRDHEREKNADSKQQCREIKQPIIKLSDFMLNTSIRTNREDKKLSHKSKRSWAVKLTTPVSNLSRKRSGKEDNEEKMSFEEQGNQSIFSEKSRNEKPFMEEEKVQDNKSKKEQTTAEERHLENKSEAQAVDLDQLNTKDEVSVKVKVGFSLNGVLSESVSVESIVSSSTSDPQQHANLNGEETIVGKNDSRHSNMQDKSHVQLSSNFPSHHPSSSKHAIPAIKRKMAMNTLDIVPIDGKIPTIKLHKMNHAGHLPSSSQTISENKIAKLKTEVTPSCSGSKDNTQSVHGIQSHAVKRRMPKTSTLSEKRKRDIQRSDPISMDGKVPVIKLQRIHLGEKQEKADMQMNINSLEEPSDRKLRKRNLSPDQEKSDSKKKNQSPSKQSEIHFETNCFESDEEDSLFSKDLLDSLLEKVTEDNGQKFGKELNISKEVKNRDGDFTPVMNVESGGLTGELGGPLANMSSIAGLSPLGHRFNDDSKRQSTGRIKSETHLQKKSSNAVRKAGIDKRLMSCSSDSNHYNSLQKTMAVKEISDQDEQQDETCNDNNKHLLPKDADEVDPEVEALIRKLKYSSHKKRNNLEPVVLLTRIDDENINLADASLKGYDLNFTQKKQTDTFGLKGCEKQMEFKSNWDSSQKLVPLERVNSPIKTGNISRQSTDNKSKTKSSSVNDKHEESIKVEVHASWSEMDSDISGSNIKFKERNVPFETSPCPSKKVRKDQELNNEVLGTVTDKINKKSLDSAGAKHGNISENVWNFKPDNFPVSCATCAYLSSPDSRLIKETYAGKGILSRHVLVAIQRLDSEIDCASTSSLNIKKEKADQKKKHDQGKKIRLREKNKKHVHHLTEKNQDSKSGRKLNIQCKAEASGSEKEDAKSLVMKIRKVLTKKEELDLKDLCLPKGKPNNHGKDVPLSGEVDINIYSTRVKLEKLDVEDTPHQFHLKISHQDRSCFNPEAFNGESGPSSKGITKGKSVTSDSGKLMSNKLSSCKQCITPIGEKSCDTGETLNRSSAFLQRPDDDTDETTDSTSKNQTGVTALPGIDAEMRKTREKSATRSDQKIRDKGLYPLDSEPESDGATSPFTEPLVDDDVKDLPQDMDVSIDSMGTKKDEPLIKREKENGDLSPLVTESPNVHRSPSDPWPKLSQDKTDKSDFSADADVSSTISPQDASQDPGTVNEAHIRSLSFSDEDGEGYKIRPGVIILDPR